MKQISWRPAIFTSAMVLIAGLLGGADGPRCVRVDVTAQACLSASDCQGAHEACVGTWSCVDATCAWQCATCDAQADPLTWCEDRCALDGVCGRCICEAGACVSEPTDGQGFVCGSLIEDTLRFMLTMLDPYNGLPHDQIPCGWNADGAWRAAQLWGVCPQLHRGLLTTFTNAGVPGNDVSVAFRDGIPSVPEPSLLFALRLEAALPAPEAWAGLTWEQPADLSRYDRAWIRYRTEPADAGWQLKLKDATGAESPHTLPGSGDALWREALITLDTPDPGYAPVDRARFDYVTFATDRGLGGAAQVTLEIDHLVFLPAEDHIADCAIGCPLPCQELDPVTGALQQSRCSGSCAACEPPPSHVDLACDEPQTGVATIGAVLSALSALSGSALLTEADARARVGRILEALEGLPGPTGPWVEGESAEAAFAGTFLQDWHGVSGMPSARNRHASITDQGQLIAGLMVAESSFAQSPPDEPDLAGMAADLRARVDLRLLASWADEASCPQVFHGAVDRCDGVVSAWQQSLFGTEASLSLWLATAMGVPACLWSALAATGCEERVSGVYAWYETGAGEGCDAPEVPATEMGGPFLQLVPSLYLSDEALPLGSLSLHTSAANMLRAQYAHAQAQGLPAGGVANALAPIGCDYMTCEDLLPGVVTPYVSALGLDLVPQEARAALCALADLGGAAPLDSGTRQHAFGFHDALALSPSTALDQPDQQPYLALDSAWSLLGALNHCYEEDLETPQGLVTQEGVVRTRFLQHPLAQAGVVLHEDLAPICP
jgi:hypothetical protein